MLRKEQNDLLTQTGPGTPMGRMFRSYWIPALLAEELPENDCPPVRVKLLSERLIAFRDTNGTLRADRRVLRPPRRLALVRPQRGMRAALPVSRLEVRRHRAVHRRAVGAGGVRLREEDQAQVLSAGRARRRALDLHGPARAAAAAARMGIRDRAAPPDVHVSKRLQESNWLQAMEGGIDSSHVSFLHRGDLNSDPLFKGARGNQYNLSDSRPVFEVVESPGGLYIGARRNAEDGNYYWRITQWVMPSFTMIAPRGNHSVHGHFWIPIDDENCWTWSFDYHPIRELTDAELAAMRDGKGIHVKYVPGTYRPARQQGQRLPDGPRGAEGRADLQRRRGHRHAGRVAAGEHGPDRRPHEGEPGLDRQRHHHGAASAAARGEGACRQGCRPAGRRCGAPDECARPPSCCRRTSRSRTARARR